MQIHEKLRQARISANLTEEELATKIGVKRSTYQYWEQKTPGIAKLKMAAKALGLKEDYFFVNDENAKRETKDNQPIRDEIPVGPDHPTDQSQVLKILENLAIGHKEACESANKMAENEKMILAKIPIVHAGPSIVLDDPSNLVQLIEVLSEISTGKLKFHTREEAIKELGIRFGLPKPYTEKLKSTQSGVGK